MGFNIPNGEFLTLYTHKNALKTLLVLYILRSILSVNHLATNAYNKPLKFGLLPCRTLTNFFLESGYVSCAIQQRCHVPTNPLNLV